MKQSKLKKAFAGFSSLCLMASALPVAPLAQISAAEASTAYLAGDTDCNGTVELNDAVKIMCYITDEANNPISEQGLENADVYQMGDGVNNMDALAIQKKLAQLIPELPESYLEGVDPVTSVSYIHLKNTYIETEGENLVIDGTTVTITASGEYYVDGTLDDGQIIVNVPDEVADPETVKIFLNGVNITGTSAPAIWVENAENTSINLMEGTTNTLSDGTVAYSGDYLSTAVIEAKDDITIKGTGTLNITANTQYAIACNNDIKFTEGTVNIETLLEDAVRGKTSVTVKGTAAITIDSEGDGIKSTQGNVAIEAGTISIKAGNDAIQAETTLDISGGSVVACGDRGLTGVTGVNITGGTVLATATDNQSALVNATQGTMLLNCIADATNIEDGCWKKANTIVINDTLTFAPIKKYMYVLISDASITYGSTYNLTNGSTGAVVTHNNELDNVFTTTGTVTTFETVNMNSTGGEVIAAKGYNITLSGTEILTDAPAEVASAADGVCTITQPGVFAVSGEMSEGQIVVNVDKTVYPEGVVELDLMGVNLSNTTDSPIYVAAIGDECQIVAKSGYDNVISDGTSYTNADAGMGAIYACDDLKIKGEGNLTVNGNAGDAVVCKNDLKLYNGTIVANAVDDAFRGKDSVVIGNDTDTDFSTLNITAKSSAGDGIKSTETDTTSGKGFVTVNGGTINISAYSDGIHASQTLNVIGGDITIETTCPTSTGNNSSSGNQNSNRPGMGGGMGGGMGESEPSTAVSAKALKAGTTDDTTSATIEGTVNISGGTVNATATDDAIHGTYINQTGGDVTVSSSCDGMHADNTLTIDNGTLNMLTSYEGIEGADIVVNGGNIHVFATNDCFNASGDTVDRLTINDGYIYLLGTNGDGVDSNGDIYINGGTVIQCGPTGGGNGIFDNGDGNYAFSVTGGTLIGIGTSDMMVTPSVSNGTYLTSSNVSLQSGNIISAADTSGNVVAVITVPSELNITGAVQFYSSNATSSTSLYSGGTYNGTMNEDGYAEGGTISGGTQLSSSSGGGSSQFPWG